MQYCSPRFFYGFLFILIKVLVPYLFMNHKTYDFYYGIYYAYSNGQN